MLGQRKQPAIRSGECSSQRETIRSYALSIPKTLDDSGSGNPHIAVPRVGGGAHVVVRAEPVALHSEPHDASVVEEHVDSGTHAVALMRDAMLEAWPIGARRHVHR